MLEERGQKKGLQTQLTRTRMQAACDSKSRKTLFYDSIPDTRRRPLSRARCTREWPMRREIRSGYKEVTGTATGIRARTMLQALRRGDLAGRKRSSFRDHLRTCEGTYIAGAVPQGAADGGRGPRWAFFCRSVVACSLRRSISLRYLARKTVALRCGADMPP